MTIEQMVEVPASRQLVLDLPEGTPTGTAKAALTLTFALPASEEWVNPLLGLLEGSPISLERFMELRHQARAQEMENDQRLWGKKW